MSRTRTRRWLLAGTAAVVVVAAWALLYVVVVTTAPLAYDPQTESSAKVNRELALLLLVPTALWVTAALLLVDRWWAQAGVRLAGLDLPGRLLAAAVATLPAHRHQWGQAMAAELAEVRGRPARWRFALSSARAAMFPPGGGRVAGAGAVAVLAVVLAGCLWLALRPPRWLVPDRNGRRFGVAMAVVLVAGFVLASRQELRSAELDVGVMDYLFAVFPLVLLAGSAAAAAVGRSFRAGLWACAWAVVLTLPLLVAVWLAEALRWQHQRSQLLLDGAGGPGLGVDLVGANLGDAIWWTLMGLVLWALPLGVIGAAAVSWRARRRCAREYAVSLG